MKTLHWFPKAKFNSLRVWGILLLIFAVSFVGHGQSGNQRRVDVLRLYRTEIEHWLLPSKRDTANTKLLAAFLVLPPFRDPDYSVCLIDSAKHFFLKVQILDKNLWEELFTRVMKKQSLDLPLDFCVYSTQVSKRFKKKMLTAFTKISPRKVNHSSVVMYDGISYEFRWLEKGEMKSTLRSYDLIAKSYESELVKILDQIGADIKNNTFKESKFINNLK